MPRLTSPTYQEPSWPPSPPFRSSRTTQRPPSKSSTANVPSALVVFLDSHRARGVKISRPMSGQRALVRFPTRSSVISVSESPVPTFGRGRFSAPEIRHLPVNKTYWLVKRTRDFTLQKCWLRCTYSYNHPVLVGLNPFQA